MNKGEKAFEKHDANQNQMDRDLSGSLDDGMCPSDYRFVLLIILVIEKE